MPDEYSLLAKTPLDTRLSLAQIERQRAMANALMQRGFQQPDIPNHGRYTPFAALANILTSGIGAYQNRQLDTKENAVSESYRKQMSDMLGSVFGDGGSNTPSIGNNSLLAPSQGSDSGKIDAMMSSAPATFGKQAIGMPDRDSLPPGGVRTTPIDINSGPVGIDNTGAPIANPLAQALMGKTNMPVARAFPMDEPPIGRNAQQPMPDAQLPPEISDMAKQSYARHDAIVNGGNIDDITKALMDKGVATQGVTPQSMHPAPGTIPPIVQGNEPQQMPIGHDQDSLSQVAQQGLEQDNLSQASPQGGLPQATPQSSTPNVPPEAIISALTGNPYRDRSTAPIPSIGGAMGAGMAPQPMSGQSPQLIASQGQRGGIYANLSPSDKRVLAGIAMQNPEQFQKMYGEGINKTVNGPTDFARMLVEAGMPAGSPLFRQLMQAHLAKENYMAPTPLHKGAFARDPMTGQMIFSPELPSGSMPSDPNNPGGQVIPIPGAAETEARQRGMVSESEARGKAKYEGMPLVDPATGMKYTVPKSELQNNGGAPVLAEAPPGMMKEAEEIHSDLGKSVSAFQQDAEHASGIKANITELRELGKNFNPGALTPMKQRLGEIGRAVGIPEAQVTSMVGNVGDMQAFNKTAKTMVMTATKQLGSREAAQIVDMISKAFPSSNMTPEGLDKMFNMIDGLADYHIAKDQAAYKWRTGIDIDTGSKVSTVHGTMDGFSEYWNRKSPIISFIPGLKNLQENQSRIDMITKDAAANMPGKHITYKFQNSDGTISQGSLPPAGNTGPSGKQRPPLSSFEK